MKQYILKNLDAIGGIALIASTLLALTVVNFGGFEFYNALLNIPIIFNFNGFAIDKNLLLFVNDGLMAIFFFMIGLEIKKEILIGQLSDKRKALFAVFAAAGGMIVPAAIYVLFNYNTNYLNGWAVPMATDIAFALGMLGLLGSRVPASLKIFMLALAIVDDLGAIAVVALFYTDKVSLYYLLLAASALLLIYTLNRANKNNIILSLFLGFFTWLFFLKSGVHATLAGVFLALLVPMREIASKNTNTIDHWIHKLHPWILFVIMPIFAFFNAGVYLGGIDPAELLNSPITKGVALALLFGNPIGITAFTYFADRLGIAKKPTDISWAQVIGVGFIAGIGFTMSLFISSLAFDSSIDSFSKVGILVGSLLSMIMGLSILVIDHNKRKIIDHNIIGGTNAHK